MGTVLICVSSIIIVIIIIRIITKKKNNNKNINNIPETRKYWVDVQLGIVSSHVERNPL